jgi:pimeloyl-ACP methyl ester carboxylesterase
MPTLALTDGSRLSFRESGAGVPVILVHGSPGDGRAWSRVAPKLPPGHRLLMPDLPGYGGSDPLPAGTRGTTAMAAAIEALAAACDQAVWLCGHSYGGNVALHAALARPDLVRGVALFEPVFLRALALAGEQAAFDVAAEHFTAYVRHVAAGDNAAVTSMVDYWFGAGAFARLPPPVRDFLVGAAPRNAADVSATFAETVTAESLRRFAPPVVIACGRASPAVTPAIAAALAKLLPQVRCETIAGANHGMLDSHPDAVAGVIASLLIAA